MPHFVFAGMRYADVLPNDAWAALVEFSLFLREHGIVSVSQSMLQSILECTVKRTKGFSDFRNIICESVTPYSLCVKLEKRLARLRKKKLWLNELGNNMMLRLMTPPLLHP